MSDEERYRLAFELCGLIVGLEPTTKRRGTSVLKQIRATILWTLIDMDPPLPFEDRLAAAKASLSDLGDFRN